MIRTILFDFGNVVAFFDHDRALRRLLTHTDRTAEELWRLFYQDNLADRYECGQVTTDELFAAARDAGGLRCSRAEFVDTFCDIFWPNPPMADLIPRLKAHGYRLVLASNTNAAHYEHYREQFKDLLAHFDAIAVSHEAGARKPHPRFFEYAHRLAACAKDECLFVDDLEANVIAAREFGWQAIHFTRFDDLVPALRAAGVQID
jgi:HAD superfamily hydrolase (TIGR01493 family)